jgi:hypothetical protein
MCTQHIQRVPMHWTEGEIGSGNGIERGCVCVCGGKCRWCSWCEHHTRKRAHTKSAISIPRLMHVAFVVSFSSHTHTQRSDSAHKQIQEDGVEEEGSRVGEEDLVWPAWKQPQDGHRRPSERRQKVENTDCVSLCGSGFRCAVCAIIARFLRRSVGGVFSNHSLCVFD